MDRVSRTVLLDTGCTDVIVSEACCPRGLDASRRPTVRLADVASTMRCVGTARIEVVYQERRVVVDALVVPVRPLGVDVLWGMSGVRALGGTGRRCVPR